MKLKIIAFQRLWGSTERLAHRGTSWSSRKLPSKVGSYEAALNPRGAWSGMEPHTEDFCLICAIMSVTALMFCGPGMVNA